MADHQILDHRPMTRLHKPVAIGARLKNCPEIDTLGFRPNFYDYDADQRQALLSARRVLYPTAYYAGLFHTMGKPTFPSFHTYTFAMDKIRQTAMFQMLDIPHPRTRVFYGQKQQNTILDRFSFPFIAKVPRGSARGEGIFLIRNQADLTAYLAQKGPAYIQEYLPVDKDMRIIVIGQKVVLAYWRVARKSAFKTNVFQGGSISFDPLPKPALALALSTAKACGWDDVGIDILAAGSRYFVLEGNMKYGTKGFQKAGIDYKKLLCDLILTNEV